MDDETLDRILMDEAAGGLDPDITALLQAYLQTRPDQAQRLAHWQRTAALAQQALPGHVSLSLPPLRLAPPRSIRPWLVSVAAAALVLIVSAIALHLPRSATKPPLAANKPVQSFVVQSSNVAAVSDFWSTRRLQTAATEQHPCIEPHPSKLIAAQMKGFQ